MQIIVNLAVALVLALTATTIVVVVFSCVLPAAPTLLLLFPSCASVVTCSVR